MDWMKKHVDTVIILTAFAASVLWMNGKFKLEKEIKIMNTRLLVAERKILDLCEAILKI